jgi:hypothetical protein
MKRRSRTIAVAFAPVRRLAMLVVLLAFAFQAYALQTHLHVKPLSATPVHMLKADIPAKPLPADPLDPATCKLCQELVHSGAIITPAGPAFTLLLEWAAAAAPPAQLSAAAVPPQTGWQSRAPPRH